MSAVRTRPSSHRSRAAYGFAREKVGPSALSGGHGRYRDLPVLIAALLLATAAPAAELPPLRGDLQLTWGDPPARSTQPARFEVELVGADGSRVALDADAAASAAGDLFALDGHAVVATLAPGPWIDGRAVPQTLAIDRASDKAGPVPEIVGNQPWVNIACKFSDMAVEPKDLAYMNGMMANTPGRMDHYWREVSYNKLDIAGSTSFGWFTLPNPRSFYEPFGSTQRNTLLKDCVAAADPSVNFAPFAGINTFYNGNMDGSAWGTAGRTLTLDGTTRSWRVTWEPPWGYDDAAPLGHEMGHGFGLPHANNSDGDSNDYDNPWDVMSDDWSNATTDPTYGSLPKHINTWSRDHLGWIDAARKLTISTDGQYSGIVLDRASLLGSTNTQMIVIVLPAPEPATHYYTIEARKRVGAYEANLAGDAVIIHEVVTGRSQPSWSMDADIPPANTANNPGSMFVVGESWVDPSGAFKVSVISATANGFGVNVQRGGNLQPDLIFRNGFQL